MTRPVLFACGFALLAPLYGCSRDPASRSRHNPADEPVQAANAGDVDAQFEVGVRIANGQGVEDPPDYARAASFLRRAADQGHAGAQAALGFMYHRGQGVPQNNVEAYKWLDVAISQHPPERDAFALWREYVARDMTAAQIAEGEKLAREWTKPR